MVSPEHQDLQAVASGASVASARTDLMPSDCHPLIAKLETIGALSQEDRDFLGLMLLDVRSFTTRKDIIRQGDAPEYIHLMVNGWSCRYTIIRNGKRQITAFLVPGDLCNHHVLIPKRMDHSIMTLGPAQVAFFSKDVMRGIADRPALMHAMWWASYVNEGVLRAWIINLGTRGAFERVAHLICELHARLDSVGLAHNGTFYLPLTQEELGDAVSLTNVHINRVLRRLRDAGLMAFVNHKIIIQDMIGLQHAASFDPFYLHLSG